jgi:hypothetical protein
MELAEPMLRPRRCHGCEMTHDTMTMSCIICSLRYALAVLYHRHGGCPTPMNLWVWVPLDLGRIPTQGARTAYGFAENDLRRCGHDPLGIVGYLA